MAGRRFRGAALHASIESGNAFDLATRAMRFTEPTTMLTDYALAALGVWLGWRLLSSGRRSGGRDG